MALQLTEITEGMSGKRVRQILNSNMQATVNEAAAVAAAEVDQVESKVEDLDRKSKELESVVNSAIDTSNVEYTNLFNFNDKNDNANTKYYGIFSNGLSGETSQSVAVSEFIDISDNEGSIVLMVQQDQSASPQIVGVSFYSDATNKTSSVVSYNNGAYIDNSNKSYSYERPFVIEVPSGAKYVRFSYYYSGFVKAYVGLGTIDKYKYCDFGKVSVRPYPSQETIDARGDFDTLGERLDDLEEKVVDVDSIKSKVNEIVYTEQRVSTNLFDENDEDVEENSVINSYGIVQQQTGYKVSGYVDISSNSGTICVTNPAAFYLCYYKESKSALSNTTSIVETSGVTAKEYIVPDNAKFVRFYSTNSKFNDCFVGVIPASEYVFEKYFAPCTIVECKSNSEIINARGEYGSLTKRIESLDLYKTPYQYIKDGYLVANGLISGSLNSQVARYIGIDVGEGKRTTTFVVKIIFDGSGSGANITLISEPNGLDNPNDITSKSVHISITRNEIIFGLFENSSNNNLKTFTFDEPCESGVEYAFDVSYSSSSKIMTFKRYKSTEGVYYFSYYSPDFTGTYSNMENSSQADDFSNYFGRYSIIEHYWTNANNMACNPKVSYFRLSGNHTVIWDDFRRCNGIPENTLSGWKYQHFFRTR